MSASASAPLNNGVSMTAGDIIENIRSIGPQLRERSTEIDEIRRLPDDVVDLLRKAGAFRMLMPKEWGGPEMNPMQCVEALEVMATYDASASWCVMIACDTGIFSAFMSDEVNREFHPNLDVAVAAVLAPTGGAREVDGGFVVNGRWDFGSASSLCDYLTASAVLLKDGKPVMNKDGAPETRIIMARPEKYHIHDMWDTTGLRGTSSNTFEAKEMFVPAHHTFDVSSKPRHPGPIFHWFPIVFAKISGIPLGIAAGAMDHVTEVLATKTDKITGKQARSSERVQLAMGQAKMKLGAARAYVYRTLEETWEYAKEFRPVPEPLRADLITSRVNAFQSSREVVQLLYDTLGSSAILRQKSPLDRHLRDVTTACMHWTGQEKTLSIAGRGVLGSSLGKQMMF